MKALASAAALLVAAATALPAQAQTTAPASAAESMFRATTVNLAAFGEVETAPDMATISLGVQVEAPTAAEAMAQNAQQMTRVVAALRQVGIAEKDIQTSSLNLNAQYQHEDNQPPRLRGYQASNIVTIQVYDLSKLGRTIDAVVGVGANQVQGISFSLKDPTRAENEARLAAVKALQARAELYATATGHRVGRLVNLSEGSGPIAFARADMAGQGMLMKSSTPVSPGELTIRIDVNGLYELTR